MNKNKILEWTGVITAIIYSLLVALNIGAEFLGFALLLISAILIGLWAYLGKHRGIFLLQIFMPQLVSLECLDGFNEKRKVKKITDKSISKI